MKLSKYLLPMTNLPDRFSNLAFWRSVRSLKDDINATFTFKFHFYCNNTYDSYFPVNHRLSVVYAKIVFDCDALQLSVAI